MQKKGFFFTLDAVMALTVLGFGLFLVLSAYLFVPPKDQIRIVSEDAMSFLLKTKIEEFNDPIAGIGGSLWRDGKIVNGKNSLLSQIGEFEAKGDLESAELFVEATLLDSIPPQNQLQILVNGQSIYPRGDLSELESSKTSTPLLLSKSAIAYGVFNESSYEIWGPSSITLLLWQR